MAAGVRSVLGNCGDAIRIALSDRSIRALAGRIAIIFRIGIVSSGCLSLLLAASACNSALHGDLPHAATMGAGTQDVQLGVQLDLVYLRVGQPRTKAAPESSEVSSHIDAVIGPHVKGTVANANLKRPHRLIRKIATDIRPGCPSVRRGENVSPGVKLINDGVADLRVGWINLKILEMWSVPAVTSCPVQFTPWSVVT